MLLFDMFSKDFNGTFFIKSSIDSTQGSESSIFTTFLQFISEVSAWILPPYIAFVLVILFLISSIIKSIKGSGFTVFIYPSLSNPFLVAALLYFTANFFLTPTTLYVVSLDKGPGSSLHPKVDPATVPSATNLGLKVQSKIDNLPRVITIVTTVANQIIYDVGYFMSSPSKQDLAKDDVFHRFENTQFPGFHLGYLFRPDDTSDPTNSSKLPFYEPSPVSATERFNSLRLLRNAVVNGNINKDTNLPEINVGGSENENKAFLSAILADVFLFSKVTDNSWIANASSVLFNENNWSYKLLDNHPLGATVDGYYSRDNIEMALSSDYAEQARKWFSSAEYTWSGVNKIAAIAGFLADPDKNALKAPLKDLFAFDFLIPTQTQVKDYLKDVPTNTCESLFVLINPTQSLPANPTQHQPINLKKNMANRIKYQGTNSSNPFLAMELWSNTYSKICPDKVEGKAAFLAFAKSKMDAVKSLQIIPSAVSIRATEQEFITNDDYKLDPNEKLSKPMGNYQNLRPPIPKDLLGEFKLNSKMDFDQHYDNVINQHQVSLKVNPDEYRHKYENSAQSSRKLVFLLSQSSSFEVGPANTNILTLNNIKGAPEATTLSGALSHFLLSSTKNPQDNTSPNPLFEKTPADNSSQTPSSYMPEYDYLMSKLLIGGYGSSHDHQRRTKAQSGSNNPIDRHDFLRNVFYESLISYASLTLTEEQIRNDLTNLNPTQTNLRELYLRVKPKSNHKSIANDAILGIKNFYDNKDLEPSDTISITNMYFLFHKYIELIDAEFPAATCDNKSYSQCNDIIYKKVIYQLMLDNMFSSIELALLNNKPCIADSECGQNDGSFLSYPDYVNPISFVSPNIIKYLTYRLFTQSRSYTNYAVPEMSAAQISYLCSQLPKEKANPCPLDLTKLVESYTSSDTTSQIFSDVWDGVKSSFSTTDASVLVHDSLEASYPLISNFSRIFFFAPMDFFASVTSGYSWIQDLREFVSNGIFQLLSIFEVGSISWYEPTSSSPSSSHIEYISPTSARDLPLISSYLSLSSSPLNLGVVNNSTSYASYESLPSDRPVSVTTDASYPKISFLAASVSKLTPYFNPANMELRYNNNEYNADSLYLLYKNFDGLEDGKKLDFLNSCSPWLGYFNAYKTMVRPNYFIDCEKNILSSGPNKFISTYNSFYKQDILKLSRNSGLAISSSDTYVGMDDSRVSNPVGIVAGIGATLGIGYAGYMFGDVITKFIGAISPLILSLITVIIFYVFTDFILLYLAIRYLLKLFTVLSTSALIPMTIHFITIFYSMFSWFFKLFTSPGHPSVSELFNQTIENTFIKSLKDFFFSSALVLVSFALITWTLDFIWDNVTMNILATMTEGFNAEWINMTDNLIALTILLTLMLSYTIISIFISLMPQQKSLKDLIGDMKSKTS